MKILFAAFLVVPVLEMWLLITIGQMIGALPTIGLVLLTAVIGVQLLRFQGISTLLRAQERLSTGNVPALEMVEGLALAVGGALLLTPGFATDAFGFACLIPASRRWMAKKLFNHWLEQGRIKTAMHGEFNRYSEDESGHIIIEGEYQSGKSESPELEKEKNSEF